MALAHHAIERRGERGVADGLTRKLEFGPALFEDGLAVAHLLDRVLVPAFGHLERGVGRVQRGLGRDAAFDELSGAVASQLRLEQQRLRRPDQARLLRVDRVVVAMHGQAQSSACLLQRRFGLVFAQVEVGGRETREDLPTGHAAAQVHVEVLQAPGDLHAEYHLLLGRQRARHGDRTDQPVLGRQDDLHLARL